MLQELTDYYRRKGILATSFTCKHKDTCKGDCKEFTGPKSAFVSRGYAQNELPRLLFLSLDSGKGEPDDRERLPSAVRKKEEVERDIKSLNKSRHWYRTHELGWIIFRKFNRELELPQAKHFFAHANSAKCCLNKKHKKKADRRLFENCREYLDGELKIFAPDILVTQGNEARQAVLPLIEKKKEIDTFASESVLHGRRIFWLHTWHPANFGKFNKQKEKWDFYAEKIHSFISNLQTT